MLASKILDLAGDYLLKPISPTHKLSFSPYSLKTLIPKPGKVGQRKLNFSFC